MVKLVFCLVLVGLLGLNSVHGGPVVSPTSLPSQSEADRSQCVVTAGVLYINGIKERQLTTAELEEFQQYQLQQYNHEKLLRRASEKRVARIVQSNGKDLTTPNKVAEAIVAPSRPSFCKDEALYRYEFPGCTVQNNKLLINGQVARELTAEEVSELKTFLARVEGYALASQQHVAYSIDDALQVDEVPPIPRVQPVVSVRGLLEIPRFCTRIV